MPDAYEESLSKSIAQQIKRSRKIVTILFTDIEGSTLYWERHGDIKGRLMVDRHNRMLFPVVKRFHGKVIKTIGDAIMASFKNPPATCLFCQSMSGDNWYSSHCPFLVQGESHHQYLPTSPPQKSEK